MRINKKNSCTKITPLQAIGAMCLDCCGNQRKEVEECPAECCPLFIYRLGKNKNSQKLPPAKSKSYKAKMKTKEQLSMSF